MRTAKGRGSVAFAVYVLRDGKWGEAFKSGIVRGRDRPTKTLYDLITVADDLDAEKLRGYLLRHESGLSTLPAPLRPAMNRGPVMTSGATTFTALWARFFRDPAQGPLPGVLLDAFELSEALLELLFLGDERVLLRAECLVPLAQPLVLLPELALPGGQGRLAARDVRGGENAAVLSLLEALDALDGRNLDLRSSAHLGLNKLRQTGDGWQIEDRA